MRNALAGQKVAEGAHILGSNGIALQVDSIGAVDLNIEQGRRDDAGLRTEIRRGPARRFDFIDQAIFQNDIRRLFGTCKNTPD